MVSQINFPRIPRAAALVFLALVLGAILSVSSTSFGRFGYASYVSASTGMRLSHPDSWTVEDKPCGVLVQDGCQMVLAEPVSSGGGVSVRAYAMGSPDLEALLSNRSGMYGAEVPLAGGIARGYEARSDTGTALRYLATGNERLYVVDAEGARSAGDLTLAQRRVLAGLALP